MGIIRFLLALSVVITHCGSLFGTSLVVGQIAVQSFYIISGFYMSLILNEKYIGVNGSYKLFITNRFYPIYISHMFVLMVFSSLPVMPLKISYVIAFFTIVFSLLLNRFISNPVDKFRQSRLVK